MPNDRPCWRRMFAEKGVVDVALAAITHIVVCERGGPPHF
jgi:hypothetical protein